MPRPLADQSETELGGPHSVLTLQRRDHRELDVLLQRIDKCSGNRRQDELTSLCRLVFPHAFAEEAVLWPLARRTLRDGEKLTLEIEQEHQEINELFTKLDTLDPDTSEHHQLFAEITELLRQDVRDEEDVLLPKLQEALDPRALRRVGRMWQVVRYTAPTRPHPTVARRLPGNALAALPLTGLDRSRDRLDHVSRRAPSPLAAGCRRTSQALATVAGAIEHLPPLRSGEDPSTRT
ncbi:hemerythrin domain-containing protein [Rhodococcus tibetensis]|uniref:Hemerythrin domain-containing protein n=1 Tax=Rhodococcus tibetensis TaxID=2965064 RepID=A0ABT1QKN4_9NOCA|nr:hemerythrin domain-containing protein [Rhodococcus sp. FXJ9.536]MCQ4122355.1 hemerythrin domain-containing protein [Rhodococcus sp. FXJ9.536]